MNDIALSKLFPSECPQADDITRALSELVAQAKSQNLTVILGTLLPWKDASLFGAPLYSEAGEAKRATVNAWIRRNTAAHGVIDFDAAVRDPRDPRAINPSFDLGDHLHCNDAGLEAMANAVDLGLLR